MQANFNCVELLEVVEAEVGSDAFSVTDQFFLQLGFESMKNAFATAKCDDYESQRLARAVNGDMWPNPESHDAELFAEFLYVKW